MDGVRGCAVADPGFPRRGGNNPKGGDANLLLSIEWDSIRLGDLADGIMTKTAHKTLPGGGGVGV